MSSIGLLIILLSYLALLFFIAHWAEKKGNHRLTNNPYIYTLSLAVYCSAWTYYGSIGVAAHSGLEYLTIYLGPVLAAPLWIIVLRKIIRIAKANKISSIADFISLRYGNSRFLGALVSMVCFLGILPYIALQLKAISETFHIVTKTTENPNILEDTSTYVAIILALFSSYYGTRYVDASEKRKGIVTAVAIESVFKLFFFLLVGIYVTYFVFDGFDSVYQRASLLEGFHQKNTIGGTEQAVNWFFLIIVSLLAIFLLPRQFQMAVIENNRESHIKTATWLFPLYLLAFNIFVYPIAWGGNILFDGQDINPDGYSLLIPQLFDNQFITVMVFLGGFSAAISMIVVASISLSVMLSNNVLIPYGFLGSLQTGELERNTRKITNIRKTGIFLMIILSYLIYRYFALEHNLVSIGLIAFVIIAQLAPSFFGAVFWKEGSQLGAISGIIIGMVVCFYTLILPNAWGNNHYFVTNGLLGNELLRPLSLFGLEILQPVSHAVFWSLTANILMYLSVSVSFKGNYRERNYAEMYVDIDQYIINHENAFIWKGTAYTSDIKKILKRFLGEERTLRAMKIFRKKYNVDISQELADSRLIKFSENLLTGHIGTASAKILISSVVKEEKITLPEVLKILEESKENIIINKKLTETSNELKKISDKLQTANRELIRKDQQKNEFLDTVTHELRTPITAIRAASEILHDDEDIPDEMRKQFLQNIISESDRLSRLIDKILDLEKFESGKQKVFLTENNFVTTIHTVTTSLQQLISNKNIKLDLQINSKVYTFLYDEERIMQVLHNLLSNAIKFCKQDGNIEIHVQNDNGFIQFSIFNDGKAISEEDLDAIFDKFYQSTKQNIKKPIGSGLGLAISKQIIEAHKGKIWAENNNNGVTFYFTLPNLKNDA